MSTLPHLSLDQFDARLRKLGTLKLGIGRARLIPADGIATMEKLYHAERAGATRVRSKDKLPFQWCTYDWGDFT